MIAYHARRITLRTFHRVQLAPAEALEVWRILTYRTQDLNASKLIRMNSLRGLRKEFCGAFGLILNAIGHESIPSLQAWIRKLKLRAKKDYRTKQRPHSVLQREEAFIELIRKSN